MIFDIANALKTVIFPSNVKFPICQILKFFSKNSGIFSMPVKCCRTFSLFSICLFYGKLIPKMLTVFNLKSVHFIPQSTSSIPLCALIPATSHLNLLGFKPEKDENMSKTFFHDLYQRFFTF